MPEIAADTDKVIEIKSENNLNSVDNLRNNSSAAKIEVEEQEEVLTLKRKPVNFRTEILKGVHSPSDVLSPFSQKISSERNSALKNFKPKSLMDKLLSVKTSSQLNSSNNEAELDDNNESDDNVEISES